MLERMLSNSSRCVSGSVSGEKKWRCSIPRFLAMAASIVMLPMRSFSCIASCVLVNSAGFFFFHFFLLIFDEVGLFVCCRGYIVEPVEVCSSGGRV
jgi:hypothetical protein